MKKESLFGIGIGITTVIVLFAIFIFFYTDMMSKDGNEISDFLSNFFGSLTLIWAVIAVYIQSKELELQRKEIKDLTGATQQQAKIQANLYLQKEIDKQRQIIDKSHQNIIDSLHLLNKNICSNTLPSGAMSKPYFYWMDIIFTFLDQIDQNEMKNNPIHDLVKAFIIRKNYNHKEHVILTDLITDTSNINNSIKHIEKIKKEFNLSDEHIHLSLGYPLDDTMFKSFDELYNFTEKFRTHIKDTIISNKEIYKDKFPPILIQFLDVQKNYDMQQSNIN